MMPARLLSDVMRVERSVKEIRLRSKYGVNLIAIKRKVVKEGITKELWKVNPLIVSPLDIIMSICL